MTVSLDNVATGRQRTSKMFLILDRFDQRILIKVKNIFCIPDK